MSQQSDLEQMLRDADAAAAAILEQDRIAPGFAVETARALIKQLSVADAAMLIGQPTLKLKPKLPINVDSLIG